MRLERSFDRQSLLLEAAELAYGPAPARIMLTLIEAMAAIGESAHYLLTPGFKLNWPDDPVAFGQAIKAAHQMLEALRPPGDPTPPPHPIALDEGGPFVTLEELFEDEIRGTIEGAATGGKSPYTRDKEHAQRLHALLGPLAKRLKRRKEGK
jgi:hypothetical protein